MGMEQYNKMNVGDYINGGDWFGGNMKGPNGSTMQSSGFMSPIMSGIGTGLNAWGGMKALGLAEDQFDFQKDSWEKNFAMMQDQYNRSLNNRRSSRAITGYETKAERDAIANHYDTGSGDPGQFNNSAFNAGQPQGTAYVDNTAIDRSGEVVKSRKKRIANGGAKDSAMLGVSGNQGTTQPKKLY